CRSGDPFHVGRAVLAVEDPDLDLPTRDLRVDCRLVLRRRLGALADRLQERRRREELQPERLGERFEDALRSADRNTVIFALAGCDQAAVPRQAPGLRVSLLSLEVAGVL